MSELLWTVSLVSVPTIVLLILEIVDTNSRIKRINRRISNLERLYDLRLDAQLRAVERSQKGKKDD